MVERYWFSVFTPLTWGKFVAMEQRYLGFSEGSTKKAKQLRLGDIIIAYVTKEKKLTGVYKISGSLEKIGSDVWGTAQFPSCISVEIIAEHEIEIAPKFLDLAETQSWFRKLSNKKYWSFAFRSPPRSIKSYDAEALIKTIKAWTQPLKN